MVIYCTDFSDLDVNFAKANGFGIEVVKYAYPAFADGFSENCAQIASFIKGMSATSMHGALNDTFYTSADPLICEVSRKRFLQSIQIAEYHSINHVVFHSAYRRLFDGHSKFAIDTFVKKSIEFWQEFEANTPENMTIYLENVEDENPEVFVQILEGIGRPKIRACLDIGHAHCSSYVPLYKWIDVLGSYIGHVHIHDNHGIKDQNLPISQRDQHLPLGQGNIPLVDVINKILDVAGTGTPFVMECDLPTSAEWLKANHFEL